MNFNTKRKRLILLSLILALSFVFSACTPVPDAPPPQDEIPGNEPVTAGFSLDSVPEFDGSTPYAVVNNNNPFFNGEKTDEGYEIYSPLDSLGRCSVALACITPELMPTEDRGDIGDIKPSGWQSVKYDIVSGKYLYHRSHLIGFQLTGENDNELNLITGTRFLNVDGMLPFENIVASYVKDTGLPVLYRVTPIFVGDELVCRGVLMEAMSVGSTPEEMGEDVLFCVFVYNCQPGIIIDYKTGESRLENEDTDNSQADNGNTDIAEEFLYILNTRTMKFHTKDCSSAKNISEANKELTSKTRDELIEEGYSPCGICKP